MKLSEFRTIKHYTHVLQSCQVIATAVFENGGSFTGVYDSSNGHWLESQADGLKEVGYLTDIHINGNHHRVVWVLELK